MKHQFRADGQPTDCDTPHPLHDEHGTLLSIYECELQDGLALGVWIGYDSDAREFKYLTPLISRGDWETIAGKLMSVVDASFQCPLCGKTVKLEEGYHSYTMDAQLCYSCKFDGGNP